MWLYILNLLQTSYLKEPLSFIRFSECSLKNSAMKDTKFLGHILVSPPSPSVIVILELGRPLCGLFPILLMAVFQFCWKVCTYTQNFGGMAMTSSIQLEKLAMTWMLEQFEGLLFWEDDDVLLYRAEAANAIPYACSVSLCTSRYADTGIT
jgi:hypothetical protein